MIAAFTFNKIKILLQSKVETNMVSGIIGTTGGIAVGHFRLPDAVLGIDEKLHCIHLV